MKHSCLHDIFDEVADANANSIALVVHGVKYSYGQIQNYSFYIARLLSELNAVKNQQRVVVLLPKAAHTLPVILGILRAGFTYVPLDYRYPKERILHIIAETKATIFISAKRFNKLITALPNVTHINIEELDPVGTCTYNFWQPLKRVSPNELAYIIYTSGSTGLPKGIMMPHRGFCNVREALKELDIRKNDRYFQFASLGFAGSLSDIFATLFSAGTLFWNESEKATPDGRNLHNFMSEQQITHTKLPPAVLASLPLHPIPSLRVLMVHGELGMSDYLNYWSNQVLLLSGYGSTEVGACGTIANFSESDDYSLLGHASCDTKIYVVDDGLNHVNKGETGEIVIDAIGVANGYLNEPNLTDKKFIDNPYFDAISPKLYRTGDLGILTESGQIKFIGRLDSLTKINGLRVDVLEVEKALSSLDLVKKAFVTTQGRRPESRKLIGFIEPIKLADDNYLIEETTRQLGKYLPSFMIPARIVVVPQIPFNINGKVDKTQLLKEL